MLQEKIKFNVAVASQVTAPQNKSKTLYDMWKEKAPDQTGKQTGYVSPAKTFFE